MLDIDDTNPVAVELSPSHGLVVVGFTRIWIYDKAPLSQTVKSYIYLDEDSDNRLANLPRCVATYDTTGSNDLIVFVSYATNNNVQAITIPSATPSTGSSTVSVTNREVRLSNFGARVACVDVDQDSDFIYFLVVHDSQANIWELQRYNIGDWESGSVDDSMATSLASGTNGAVGSNVNGLVVCGSDCPATCGQTTCSCPTTAPLCGFCIDDSTICQCENPAQEGCMYEDATLEANCFVPDPHFDSYCIVELPLAQRRKGGPIRVFGVAVASATISVSRLAQTGRWNTDTLPINTVFTGSNGAVNWDGFEAGVPSSGRGRRFGVYEADITPTDVSINGESIPCIATENSGFYNQYYTYTRSIGQSVTLVATMASNLLQFVDDVRWYFTGFSTTTGLPLSSTPISECEGQLTCTLNSLAETHQGVYEAYRIRRGKRTWHPIFYLFVRGCADGSFGTTCSGTCPTCVHGECDDISGLCTCQAGWSGADCDTVCGAGEVGQACGITCSDIIPARADCSGLSFCVPGKVGCHCYSGLEAPDCMNVRKCRKLVERVRVVQVVIQLVMEVLQLVTLVRAFDLNESQWHEHKDSLKSDELLFDSAYNQN
ncbi:Tyrosine-protein kinase receptor Tie-1 [Holothuria leucospilota]|uniref:Tyrosine-protein kinase receptor Tie-1 n=1 Tax=Holothuria leucospilota TaxID=206669 RepID=A0A9Q1C982_HOLLE|nr:Tyrosine-protein kinase receptor Tie-1 [Holothuria leucospilota]